MLIHNSIIFNLYIYILTISYYPYTSFRDLPSTRMVIPGFLAYWHYTQKCDLSRVAIQTGKLVLWLTRIGTPTSYGSSSCFPISTSCKKTLWLFDDFPINTSIYKGFSMAMLNNQMVNVLCKQTKSNLWTNPLNPFSKDFFSGFQMNSSSQMGDMSRSW